MIVQSLDISNYRNIESIEFQPSPGVNVIYGENAQGKTNLLEAIWLFTGLRSFRGSKERELRRFDAEAAKLSMAFHNDVRDMTADILITDKKTASLGGLPYGASTKLVGEFLAVIFAPQHLDLIKGGPAERRKFLNQALCQLKPNYAKALTQFNRAMQQRNQLLKDAIYHSELYDTLDVWDDRFCTFGAYVISERMKYSVRSWRSSTAAFPADGKRSPSSTPPGPVRLRVPALPAQSFRLRLQNWLGWKRRKAETQNKSHSNSLLLILL